MSAPPNAPPPDAVPDAGPARPQPSPRVIAAIAVASAAVGLVLRVLAARTDPWLDEVWTLELLPRMLGPTDVLFELHHSNNHPTNTLLLYWLGDGGRDFWWYRLHTVAAGVATIVVAVFVAARRGVAEAGLAGLLFATSFIAVHHSSQARGYALMLLGVLGAFHALQRHHDRPTLGTAAAYAVAIGWALLSNLYALTALIGLSLWSAVRAVEHHGGVRAAIGPLVRLHAVPAVVFAGIVAVFYLPGLSGTQFTTNHSGIVVQSFSLLLGGPFVGPRAPWLVAAGILLMALGMAALRRDPDREWLAYALVIVVAPALVIQVSEPRALFVRFFAVAQTFALLLIAIGLGWLARRHVAGRVVAVLVAAAITAGNATHVERLIRAGRGQYLAACEYMALESVGEGLLVGSDHAFGTSLMLRFYDPLVPGTRLRFVAEEDPARAPEWFVRVGHPRPPELLFAGHLYDRDRAFPGGGFGLDWQLYRRVPMADAIRRRSDGGS